MRCLKKIANLKKFANFAEFDTMWGINQIELVHVISLLKMLRNTMFEANR